MTKLIPAPGRLVRMHDRNFAPMPPEGADVEIDHEYARMILKGDVLVVPEKPVAAVQPKAAPVEPENLPKGDTFNSKGR